MRRRAFGGQGEQTLRLRAGDKRRVIRMALHGSELVIVQSGASQAFIVPGEAHRLNDMQTEARVGAQADNIPGVRRDLWFE